MKAMILAAGEGQRFRPYTEMVPKPALPFCGYPLLYYSLFQLRGLALSEIILNAYHLPDKIQKLVENLPLCFEYVAKISNEKTFGKLLGSGGGIAFAKNFLKGDDPFVVLNGDEVILPLNKNYMVEFYNYFKTQNSLACLLTTSHPEAGKKFGAVWVDESNRVYGFGKIAPVGGSNLKPLHFLGTQILDAKIFNYLEYGIESNILYDALNAAILKNEKIYAFPIDCYWYETGNLLDFLNATDQTLNLIQQKYDYLINFYNELGNEYSYTKVKSRTILSHRSAEVSYQAEISGFLVAGPNSIVDKTVNLKNVVLGENYKTPYGCNLINTLCL
jgi:mannose-1-phosphate guanylyltransferase